MSPGGRQRTRRRRGAVPALVIVVGIASLVACSDDGPGPQAVAPASEPSASDSTSTSTPTEAPPSTSQPAASATTLPRVRLEVASDHVGYVVDHDGSLSVSELRDPSRDPGCGMTTAFFSGARDLRIEAVPTSCTDVGSVDVDAGDHGRYRTIDDVADPIDVEEVDTAIGPAVLFDQDYDGTLEPLALVTLDDPVSPAYPTLVIRSLDAGFDRSELRAMLDSLRPAGSMFAD